MMRQIPLDRTSVLAIASMTLMLDASPAFAQATSVQPGSTTTTPAPGVNDQADPAASPTEPATGLTDIVVTARRRSESLQKVPVAVTAISSAELDARSTSTISEIAAVTPNLRFSEASRGGVISNVTLRGQTNVNSTIANDPAVGIYFDEVYVARSAGALFGSVQDMASVEVLRGNQGTLFGRNSTGGAILLTPNRPNLDKIEGSAQIGFGNLGRVEYGGVLSIPLVEGSLAVRGSLQSTNRDAFARSLTNGTTLGDRNRFAGRAAIRWQPASNVTFDLGYDYSRVNETGTVSRNLSAALPAGAGYYDSLSAIPRPLTYAKVQGYTFKGEYRVSPEVNFKTVLGYRTVDFENTRDVDGLAIIAVDARLYGNQSQFSGEFQVNGEFDVGLSWLKKLNYVTGFYYFTEKGLDESSTPLQSATPRVSSTRGKNDSVAGYAQADLGFTDSLSAFGGLRFTRDGRQLTVRATAAGACSLTGNPPNCQLLGTSDFSFVSWSAGLRYAVSNDVNVYFRAARGQRSGGLDDTPTSIVPFKPEQLTDYEIGIKASLFDRRLRTNLAVFTGNYDDVQRSVLLLDASNIPYTSVFNAAKARVRGVEAEATLQIVREFKLFGSVGYTDAAYSRFIAPATGLNAAGNRFNQVPEWTYSLSAEANLPTAIGKFDGRVDFSHQSSVQFEVFNNPNTLQPGYGLLNARLAFTPDFALGRFQPEIAVFGKNLTKRRYNVDGLTITGLGSVVFRNSDPQVYGVDLKVRF